MITKVSCLYARLIQFIFTQTFLILYYMLFSLENTHVSVRNFVSIFSISLLLAKYRHKIPLAISIIFLSFDPFHRHRISNMGEWFGEMYSLFLAKN